jgi:hypothetical protein
MDKPLCQRIRDKLVSIDCGCLVWIGAKNFSYGKAYGVCSDGGRLFYVHRWAYQQKHGPIPENKEVCHRCPCCKGALTLCVNWNHLEADSHAGNMTDSIRDGTMPRGIRNGQAKLSDSEVAEIRALCLWRESSFGEIARRYGISHQHVSALAAGKWRR